MTEDEEVVADPPSHLVLRARIGFACAVSVDAGLFADVIARGVADALQPGVVDIDVLQVGLAIDPAWRVEGPRNRAEGRR